MQKPKSRTMLVRSCQVLFILLALYLLAAIFIDGTVPIEDKNSSPIRYAAIPALLIFIALAAKATQHLRDVRFPDNSLGAPKFDRTEADDILKLLEQIRNVVSNYSDGALDFFTDSLIFQNLYSVRAVEEAAIEPGALRLDTTVTLDIPDYARRNDNGSRGQPSLVVPIVRAKKGALLDNLTIEDVDGKYLSAISQRETKTLISYVVSNLYWKAYIDPNRPLKIKKLNSDQRQILSLMLFGVNQIGKIDASLLQAMREMLLAGKVKNSALAGFLMSLLEFVTKHYIVAVEVPLPQTRYLVLKHSNHLPLFEQDVTFKDRLRLRLGLTPYRFTVPLYWPFVAASYHFQMRATPGQYVNAHSLFRVVARNAMNVVRQSEFASYKPRPYLRVRYRAGLPYAHLYTRDLNKVDAFSMCTRVEFNEVPPGMLGAALAVSFFTTVLIGVFGVLGRGTGYDLPALILASPGVVASFIGFGSDSQNLLRTSLSARFGLLISGAISFAASLLYIAQSGGHLPDPVFTISLISRLIVWRNVSLWWMLLFPVTFYVSIYLTVVLTARSRDYISALRRRTVIDNVYLAE